MKIKDGIIEDPDISAAVASIAATKAGTVVQNPDLDKDGNEQKNRDGSVKMKDVEIGPFYANESALTSLLEGATPHEYLIAIRLLRENQVYLSGVRLRKAKDLWAGTVPMDPAWEVTPGTFQQNFPQYNPNTAVQ